MDKILLASPHLCGKEKEYVEEAIASNWVAPLGPHVDRFEEEIAAYAGMPHAAALISGTAALHLALRYLGVGPGDKVFCSDLTFVASCNPIFYQGATPVLIDSEQDSYNMSPAALEKAFRHHKPKAVLVVHLYGQAADMKAIRTICDAHGVPIVEDAAESLGATCQGRMTGSLGDFGVFSFNGNKIITTSGGGMLLSNKKEAIEKARYWATQARDPARHYQHSEVGYNYRLSNISAAIGRAQLTVLEERIAQKKVIYEMYKAGFSDLPMISMIPYDAHGEANYWLSVLRVDAECPIRPLDIILSLEEENIESRHVWKPMHLQPLFDGIPFYAHHADGSSVGADFFQHGVCLPSDTKMTAADQQRVIDNIRRLWSQKCRQVGMVR